MPASAGECSLQMGVSVLGVIENMSVFIPPDRPEARYSDFWAPAWSAGLASEGNVPPACPALPLEMAWWKAETGAFPLWCPSPDSPTATTPSWSWLATLQVPTLNPAPERHGHVSASAQGVLAAARPRKRSWFKEIDLVL